MIFEKSPIDGVVIIRPKKLDDLRGFFSETFSQNELTRAGIDVPWVQDNHSLSVQKGVLRGLHFQTPPNAQAKLVRVIRGSIYDVAVDIRKSSPTYGQHFGIELSRENWTQVYVAAGFAHGFCTLEDNTEVIYKVSSAYSRAHEGGLPWDDRELAIPWPISPDIVTLSERDRKWQSFGLFDSPFL